MKRLAGAGLLALIFMFAAPQASTAAVQTLTFEGLKDFEQVLQFYNGGAGSQGSVGPDFNITFGGGALASIDADAGGNGQFANEPSPSTVAAFLGGAGVVMNVPNGFTHGFSFFFSASLAGSVKVYDGPNATGNLLATLPLPANSMNDNCTGDPTGFVCNWDPIGVTFVGTARSVDFGGAANVVAFDEITLESQIPGQSPPLCDGRPATIIGTPGNNTINGTPGADVITAGDGNDTITGNGGDDVICGEAGVDRLDGNDGNDRLLGGDGGDGLFGGNGVDRVLGGNANDVLDGGGGNDSMDGNAGDDSVTGNVGDDSLFGNVGNDKLFGSAGNDKLDGGTGTDSGDGGPGTDSAVSCETTTGIP